MSHHTAPALHLVCDQTQLPIATRARKKGVAAALHALLKTARKTGRRIARPITHRFAVRRLCDLTEAELRDIGLTRMDVHRALNQPFWDDPSDILVRITRR